MLNASCAANVNEVCAIRSSSVLSSNLMTSMNQNESVILDLSKAVSYFFEFTTTYHNIRILLKADYSNCKLIFFSLHELCIIAEAIRSCCLHTCIQRFIPPMIIAFYSSTPLIIMKNFVHGSAYYISQIQLLLYSLLGDVRRNLSRFMLYLTYVSTLLIHC